MPMNLTNRLSLHKEILLGSALWWSATGSLVYAESNLTARMGATGEFLELHRLSDGEIVRDYLPVHQSGNIRYFSAGVGVEERQAEYPLFSLKLIFTAGGKPYLTGLEVNIRTSQGEPAAGIPKERIEGPRLFVDLPSGVL